MRNGDTYEGVLSAILNVLSSSSSRRQIDTVRFCECLRERPCVCEAFLGRTWRKEAEVQMLRQVCNMQTTTKTHFRKRDIRMFLRFVQFMISLHLP